MTRTKKYSSAKKINQPLIRVTFQAKKHLTKIVTAREKLGMVDSYTRFVSELILSTPIPNGTQVLPAAEVKKINEEARP